VGLSGRPRRATIGLSWFTKKRVHERFEQGSSQGMPKVCKAGIPKTGALG
jgi:hypothetical protein